MTEVTPALIKRLFFLLVKEVGGLEAAGAYLGVSNQRVSQLQNPNTPDLPTLIQVTTLEGVVGLPIVTGALASAVQGSSRPQDLILEAMEATEASADVQRLARNGAPPREVRSAVVKAEQELRDVRTVLDRGET